MLITAAICPDQARALDAIISWLNTTNLDDTVFSEHRLLTAITARFDDILRTRPEYPRLQGMQRLNWTRSRLAAATATPALAKIAAQGIDLVLLKGAGRVAMDVAELKSRTSYDIDVLVCDQDFETAFEVLIAERWKSARGESTMGLRARLSSVRARNFKKGHFGDIDLHRSPYHFGQQDPVLDRAFFNEASPANYYGVAVRIPAVEERLCMAMAHGGRDSGGHSDWLVDMAHMIESEEICWDKVLSIIHRRGITGVACIALSYLANDLGLPIPATVIMALAPYPSLAGIRYPVAVLTAKDSGGFARISKLASELDNGLKRLRNSGRNPLWDAPRFLSITRRAAQVPGGHLEQVLTMPLSIMVGVCRIDIVLSLASQARYRRVDFELNSSVRNIAHFRAFNIWRNSKGLKVRFRGVISLTADDYPLTLHALPGKLLDETACADIKAKYDPVPFVITRLDLRLKL